MSALPLCCGLTAKSPRVEFLYFNPCRCAYSAAGGGGGSLKKKSTHTNKSDRPAPAKKKKGTTHTRATPSTLPTPDLVNADTKAHTTGTGGRAVEFLLDFDGGRKKKAKAKGK